MSTKDITDAQVTERVISALADALDGTKVHQGSDGPCWCTPGSWSFEPSPGEWANEALHEDECQARRAAMRLAGKMRRMP